MKDFSHFVVLCLAISFVYVRSQDAAADPAAAAGGGGCTFETVLP